MRVAGLLRQSPPSLKFRRTETGPACRPASSKLQRGEQAGQTLLEIALTLGVAVIVASAIGIITFNGLKNSQFSKNQAQATKLAQEGLEKVRAIRDRDYTACTIENQPSSCQVWSSFWDFTCSPSCTFVLTDVAGKCSDGPGGIKFCLITSREPETLNPAQFKRQIIISDEGVSQKRVKAQVFWNDASGKHTSDLVTILARY